MADRIKGITVQLGGDVGPLNKALETVNNKIKDTSSRLKDVEKLLKLDPTNTELIAQKQKLLAEAVSETKEKLTTLKTAAEQANKQLKDGTITQEQYDGLQREIVETEQALKRLEQQSASTNSTMSKISEVGGKFQKIGDAATNSGKKLTTGLTVPIVAVGTAAVKLTADFDEQMSKVGAISGAAGDDMELLGQKAQEMGAKTKFSATESAQAFEYMAMAGWKTGDMLDGVEGIMNLAAASGEDLATTSDIVTDAITAFGMKAADAGRFADVMAAASSNANTNVALLGESFKYVAATAGAMGFSVEDTNIALGLMANAGIKGSAAGNSLKNALVNLTKPTKQQAEAMKALGWISTETVQAIDFEKVEKASHKVEKATNAVENAQTSLNDAISKYGRNSSQAQKAANALENAQINLKEAEAELQKQQEGVSNTIAKGNVLMTNEDGSMKSLKEIMDGMRGSLGQLGVSLVDADGNARDFDDIINDLTKSEDGLTQAQQLQYAATIFGKQNMAGMLSILNASEEDYEKLTKAIYNSTWEIDKLSDELQNSGIAWEEYKDKSWAAGKDTKTVCNELGENIGQMILDTGTDAESLALVVQKVADQYGMTIQDATRAVDATYKGMKESTGAAQTMAEKMLDNLNGQLTLLKSAVEGLLLQIGSALMPTIRKIVSWIQAVVDKLNSMDEGTKNTIIKIGLIVAAIGPALLIFGKLSATIGAAMKGFAGLSGKITGLLTKLPGVKSGLGPIKTLFSALASPIGIAVAAVGSLIAAFVTLWKNNEEFRNKITEIWNHLVKNFQKFTKMLTERINALGFNFTSIVDVLKGAWEGFCNFLAPIFESVFKIVHNVLTVAMYNIIGVIDFFTAIFKGDWSKAWETAKTILSNCWKGMQAVISNVVHIVKQIVNGFLSIFGTDWDTLWEGCKNTVSVIWNGITTVFRNAVDTVKSIWGNIGKWFTERWEAIKGAFQNVASFFRTKFTLAINAVKKVWDGIKSFFSDIWTSISTNETLVAIVTAISKPFTDAWDTIKAIWDTVETFFTTLWTNVTSAEGLTGILSAISKPFTDAWDTISTKFTDFATTFLGWFGTIDLTSAVAGVTSWVAGAWETISTTFTNVGDTIKGWFGTIDLTDAVAGVSSWVSGAWDTISGKLTDIGTTITNWFGTIDVSAAVAGVSSWVTDAWTTISTQFTGIGDTIKGWFGTIDLTDAVAGVSSWCATSWQTISDQFSNAATSIVGFFDGMDFTTVSSTVSGWAATAWTNIKTAFATVLTFFTNDVVGNIKAPFADIATWFSDTFAGAWKAVTDLFGNVGEWAAGVWEGIKSGIQSASQWVSDAATATGKWITQAGVDVGDFFKDGWENGWGLWGNKEPEPVTVEVKAEGAEEATSSVESFKQAIEGVVATGALDKWYSEQFTNITETVKSGSETVIQLFTDLQDSLITLAAGIKKTYEDLKTDVDDKLLVVARGVSSLLNGVKTTMESMNTSVSENLATIKQCISDNMDAIDTKVRTGLNGLNQELATSLNNVKNAIVYVLGNLPNRAYIWGADICIQLANGLYRYKDNVKTAANSVAQVIKDVLGFSLPKTGPLVDADTYMPDFIQLMTNGLLEGKDKIHDSVSQIASLMSTSFSDMSVPGINAGQLGIGGYGTTNHNKTVNLGGIEIVVNGYNAKNDRELADMISRRFNERLSIENAVWG